MSPRFVGVYAALLTAIAAAYLLVPGDHPGWLYDVAGLLCVAAIAIGMRVHTPAGRAVWRALGAGVLLLVTGDLVYEVLDRPGVEPPFPSLADIPYLLAYPFLVLGLWRAGTLRGGRDRASSVDGVVVALAVAVPVWTYWIAPAVDGAKATDLATVVSVGYPVLDLAIVAAVARLALAGGRRTSVGALLGAGLLLLFAADVAYNVEVLAGTYVYGGPLDTGWIVAYGLWGCAALHPSAAGWLEPEGRRGRVRGTGRAGALVLAALTPLSVIAVEFVRGERLDLTIPVLTFMALAAVVAVRIAVASRTGSAAWRGAGVLLAAPVVLVAMAVGLVQLQQRGELRDRIENELFEATVDLEQLAAAEQEARERPTLRSRRALVAVRRRLERRVQALDRGPLAASRIDPIGDELETYRDVQDRELRLRSAGRGVEADVLMDTRIIPAREAVAAELRARRGQYQADAARADELGRLGSVVVMIAGLGLIVALLAKFSRARGATALARADAEAVQDREARFRALVAGSADIITVVGPDTTILAHPGTVERVLGHATGSLGGTPLSRALEPERREAAAELLRELAGGVGQVTAEWRLRRADGSSIDTEVLATDHTADPRIGGFVLNIRDVTTRKALEARLHHQALHDHLTGLANRALLEDRITQALGRAIRRTQRTAILFIDLDDFKLVNDSLGHAVGDELLVAVGDRLRPLLRPSDTLARLGGDEFAVLLEELDDLDQAKATAEWVLACLRRPIELAGRSHVIRASLGIAVSDGGGAEGDLVARADELLRHADLAMYEAKRQGDGRFEVFVPKMHEAVSLRMLLKSELQLALDEGQLVVHYQPIVEIDGGGIAGFEALVRWQHPTRGLVPPGDFIAAAEQTGQIVELGLWVMREACRRLADWRAEWPGVAPYVAVNVSGRQLQSDTFVEEVADALAETGLPPDALLLEVTESALIQDTDGNERRMSALHDLGVRLAIDDFGTGYSSLSYLRRFPMDVLKIDKSFVDDVAHPGCEASLIDAMIRMGASLNLRVVAEGIEDPEQLDALAALNCGLGQGYLFARPLPAPEVARYLAAYHGPGPPSPPLPGPTPLTLARQG